MFTEEVLLKIRDVLLKNGETIAVAESVTSGFLQAAFSTVPDGAKFFHGGITAYNLGQKYRHLQVSPIHAEESNCVSEKVAMQMATNVCSLFSSEWGMGITGYASKVPEGKEKLFAHYAIAYKNQVLKKDVIEAGTKEGEETQIYFVNEVLNALHEVVQTRKRQ